MTSGERLTMAPKAKSQKTGRSMTLTGTPAPRAAAAKSAAEASSSKAPMAIAAPFRSSSPQPRACTVTGPRGGSATIAAMSSDTSVA